MPSYSDTLGNYITRVRQYLAEPDPDHSRWTDDFLKQIFNSCYRRRVAQLVMAHEGAFINEVRMPVLTSNTVYNTIFETFEQLVTFTALNAQSTISLDTAIYQQGSASLNLNKAAGNATVGFYKTFASAVSLSTAYDRKAYLYYYSPNTTTLTSTGIQIKLGFDSSNYYQWNIASSNDITVFPINTWNKITLDLSAPTSTTGSPSLAAVTYMEVNLVFGAAGTVQAGYKFDNLYFEERPTDIAFYPWPLGFERMTKLEMETNEGRRIPLQRDERAARSMSPNDNNFVGGLPWYRPVAGGFVLEPPINSSSSIANIVLNYVGTPPKLVNDDERLGSDFPVTFDELLVLDTAISAMDSESLLEGGAIRSVLRLRMEWDEDYLRYIDDRISALRRIELADSYYEDY